MRSSKTGEHNAAGLLRDLKILIVEDNWELADTFAVFIEEEGGRVIGPCATVASASAAIEAHPVDFALIDMNLSDAFADTLTESLVERGIPYAIVTGYEALPSNAYADAVAVVKKPVRRARLIETIKPFVS